jgi:hypothetical protein
MAFLSNNVKKTKTSAFLMPILQINAILLRIEFSMP